MGLEAAPETEVIWDFDYGIKMEDGFTIKPIPFKKGCKYFFYNKSKILVSKLEGKTPLELTENSTIGKEIKKHIDPDNAYNKTKITNIFGKLKVLLNNFVDEFVEIETAVQKQNEEDELAQNKQTYEEGLNLFETKDNPLLYIASLTDWYTAGERINTMITFLCYCSQVILKNPISVIGLGEGSSGKTFVENTALSMIPPEFVIYEKKPTLPAMFRRAESNPYYYDGKIVVYGDMGGSSDQDEVEETKNLLKELQTDGHLVRPITIKVDGEFEVVDLVLKGFPCLTYTTVPNYDFDSQELSRSFIFTPRTDNRKIFNAQKSCLELKGSKTEQIYQSMLNLKSCIQSMVLGLRYKFSDIIIVNPYSESILKFIGESEFYKRDYDKYNGILKVITAFNSIGRPVFKVNNQNVIFTQPEDIQYFVSLFSTYKASITHNLSKKATEIYKDIIEQDGEWDYQPDTKFEEALDFGFTVNDYYEKGNVHLNKRSLQRYFSELNREGYLKVVGKSSRSNMYALMSTSSDAADWTNLFSLSEFTVKHLEYEYPENIVESIILNDNVFDEEVSILNQSDDVIKPFWVDFDE